MQSKPKLKDEKLEEIKTFKDYANALIFECFCFILHLELQM